jgi:hypothetical protein
VKKLLAIALCISSATFLGAAPQSATKDPVDPDPNMTVAPRLDIPKNCQQTTEDDGSVLMTCECKNCGQPEARDGPDPVPWTCVSRKDGVTCGYGLGAADEAGSRAKTKI